jgi:hypothetical protein
VFVFLSVSLSHGKVYGQYTKFNCTVFRFISIYWGWKGGKLHSVTEREGTSFCAYPHIIFTVTSYTSVRNVKGKAKESENGKLQQLSSTVMARWGGGEW